MDALPRRRAEKKAAPAPAPVPAADPDAPGPVPYQSDVYNPARQVKLDLFNPEAPPRRPWLITRVRAWLTSGTVSTRYSVQVPPADVSPPGDVFIGETEKHKGRGVLPVYSAEVAPLSFLSFEGQYGNENHLKGVYEDHYWVHAPDITTLTYNPTGAVWHNPNHEDDLVYAADSSVKREWAAATMYLRVIDAKINAPEALDLRHTLDVAFGAERYRQDSRDTNLRIDSNKKMFYSNANPGPIAGLDSSYDAEWVAPHVGLREEMSTRGGFSLQMLVLWAPAATYSGRGFYNLSAQSGSLRAETPNYQDWAHGMAVHFDLGMGWSWSVFRLEAGYQRLTFWARHGTRRYYKGDGTTQDRTLDLADTSLGGAYAGASLRF
jgi:hypothetical protein